MTGGHGFARYMFHWRPLIIASLLLSLLGEMSQAAKVRLAIPGYNVTQIAFFTARERGYFREESLDVELIQMTGNLANLALMSGEVLQAGRNSVAASPSPATPTRSTSGMRAARRRGPRAHVRQEGADGLVALGRPAGQQPRRRVGPNP